MAAQPLANQILSVPKVQEILFCSYSLSNEEIICWLRVIQNFSTKDEQNADQPHDLHVIKCYEQANVMARIASYIANDMTAAIQA